MAEHCNFGHSDNLESMGLSPTHEHFFLHEFNGHSHSHNDLRGADGFFQQSENSSRKQPARNEFLSRVRRNGEKEVGVCWVARDWRDCTARCCQQWSGLGRRNCAGGRESYHREAIPLTASHRYVSAPTRSKFQPHYTPHVLTVVWSDDVL